MLRCTSLPRARNVTFPEEHRGNKCLHLTSKSNWLEIWTSINTTKHFTKIEHARKVAGELDVDGQRDSDSHSQHTALTFQPRENIDIEESHLVSVLFTYTSRFWTKNNEHELSAVNQSSNIESSATAERVIQICKDQLHHSKNRATISSRANATHQALSHLYPVSVVAENGYWWWSLHLYTIANTTWVWIIFKWELPCLQALTKPKRFFLLGDWWSPELAPRINLMIRPD